MGRKVNGVPYATWRYIEKQRYYRDHVDPPYWFALIEVTDAATLVP
jgi:hypothetical protein